MSALPTVALRVLGFGQPDDVRALFDRDPQAMRSLLASASSIPPVVVDTALAVGGQWPEVLAKRCLDRGPLPEFFPRLAAAGNPRVAAVLYGHSEFRNRTWSLRAHRALLAEADPADPRWRAETGLVRRLLGSENLVELRAAVVAPFPDLVRHVLVTVGAKLDRDEWLRALLSLHEHGGAAELADALADEAIHGALETDIAEIGAGAVAGPDGVAALRAAVADAEGTPGAVAKLRAKPIRTDAVLAQLDRLDWSAVGAAHQERPFDHRVIEKLAVRDDCPDEVAAALCAAHPNPPIRELFALVRPSVLSSLLTTMPVERMSSDVLTVVVERALGETLSGVDLLRRARPAVTVLATAQQRRADRKARPAERDGWAEFRAELGRLVAERLGADVAAWRLLRADLPTFTGSVAELLDSVAARAASTRGDQAGAAAAAEPWPSAGGAPKRGRMMTLSEDRAAFLTLLDLAATDTQLALLAEVDDGTAYDLLVCGTWRAEWLPWVLAEPGRHRDRQLLARHPNLPADAVTALARLDDPAVNAGLIYQANATRQQRDRLITGRPFADPEGDRRLPVDPELRAALLATRAWRWLGPMVGCGDPELIKHVFASVRVSGTIQLRMLLGLWERGGPDAAEAELAAQAGKFSAKYNATVRRQVSALLAEPDRADALQRLRAAVADAESPERLARRLRASGLSSLHRLRAEGFDWDWDHLCADHARKPFPGSVLRLLAEVEDCPEELRSAARQSFFPEDQRRALARLAAGTPPAEVLAEMRLAPGMSWPLVAVERGGMTMADLVHFGQPAAAVLAIVPADHPVHAELGELVRAHLAGNQDAWTLVMRLLPDFAGTIPDLLESAVLATRPAG